MRETGSVRSVEDYRALVHRYVVHAICIEYGHPLPPPFQPSQPLSGTTCVPPRPVLAFDHANELCNELVARFRVAGGIQPLQVRDHVVGAPALACKEEVREARRGVQWQRVHGEVRDEFGGRVERRRRRVAQQVVAREELEVDEVRELVSCG